MSDHDALLAAILASPDDDLPRLVFADWLEESGHPANVARAQYIRLQVEAARYPDGADEALRLVRAAAAHRGAFEDEADRALGGVARTLEVVVIRRRGFVDEVRGTTSRVLPACEWLFAVAPVRLLDLDAPADPFGRLRPAAWLGRLRELRIRVQYGARADATRAVVECPWLTGLTRLDLSRNGLSDGWVVEFVRRLDTAAFAGTLRVLDLSGNFGITDAGASALAAARGLDRLLDLRLAGCGLTGHGVGLLRRRFGDRVGV